MKTGDTAYIVESNRYIREVKIIRINGDMFLVRFTYNGGGIQVRKNRLFPSADEAEASIHKTTSFEKRKTPRSPYDFWY